MALLEQVLVLRAHPGEAAHVDVVERRQHSGVFCASLRRRAIVWRRRVIFTRSSPASGGADGTRSCWLTVGIGAGT